MPQNKYALARYKLIDQIFRRNSYVKTTQIVDLCRYELGYSVSQRTIQLDLCAMKEDAFLGIYAPIEYCRKRKSYYYTKRDFTLNPLSFTDEEVDLLETICTVMAADLGGKDIQALHVIVDKMKRFYKAK